MPPTSEPASEDAPFTFINAFEIAPESIDAFVERWVARSRFITVAEGFIDATLYRAVTENTRFQLVNVSKWTSYEAHEAAGTDPAYREELAQLLDDLSATLTVNRGYYRTVAHMTPPPEPTTADV